MFYVLCFIYNENIKLILVFYIDFLKSFSLDPVTQLLQRYAKFDLSQNN